MKILLCSNASEFAKNISIMKANDIYSNKISKFEDNELNVKIPDLDKLNHQDVLVIQSISNNVNDALIELLFTLDILKNSNVKSIKLLITYIGYSRQDRMIALNESFSFKIIARMFSDLNISKVYLINIHSAQTTGFFNIPCINIPMEDFICDKIKTKYKNLLLISPDVGNVKTIISMSQLIGCEYSIAIKYRPRPNENKILSLIGTNVENMDCVIVDDLVDSAGTICNVAEILAKKGANRIDAYITHPVLSKKSIQRIKNSYINKLYVSNTINANFKIHEIKNKVEIFSISDYVIDKIKNSVL